MSELPLVFVIGDSISIGYTPHVKEALAGRARVERHPGNCGDSFNVLSNLPGWLAEVRPALIHFNVGLHDLRLWRHISRHQVEIETYRGNLTRICELLVETGAKLLWATTTPVLEGAVRMGENFSRKNADVEAYNAVALEVINSAGIAIAVDDLNAFVKTLDPEKALSDDGVHFTGKSYARLGAEVARNVTIAMGAG